ncbi:hypothetical protein B0H34DRAFT_440538 [Crassisporium funariophilum]|nr:hypothetical protein B0H34DRAFT_440538 [Crassisporium funariophilum]
MEEERRSEATREGTVDVDSELSSSAQPEWKAVSATQKQDERKQPAWETPPSPSGNNDHHQDDENYAIYSSPFESYPLLRGRSRPTFSSDQVSHSHSLSLHSSSYMYPSTSSMSSSSPVSAETSSYSISSPSYPFPNLKPLKLATMSKVLDPFKRLCRYEVPGGGMCRDEGCEDVHLNRLDGVNEMGVVEPSDRDTAEYLFNTMPSSWLERYQVSSSSKIFEALQQIRYNTVNDPLGFEDRVAQALFALGDSRPT